MNTQSEQLDPTKPSGNENMVIGSSFKPTLMNNQSEHYVEPKDRSNQIQTANYLHLILAIVVVIALGFSLATANINALLLTFCVGLIGAFLILIFKPNRAPVDLIRQLVAIEGNPKIRNTLLNIVAADTGLYWSDLIEIRKLLEVEVEEKTRSYLLAEATATGSDEEVAQLTLTHNEELTQLQNARTKFEAIFITYKVQAKQRNKADV